MSTRDLSRTESLITPLGERPSVLAVRFFFVSVLVFSIGGGLWRLLVYGCGSWWTSARVVWPHAFWISTLLLLAGSFSLHRATGCVRIEKQRPFRRWLLTGITAGTLFVSFQCFGLWSLLQNLRPDDVSTGAAGFAFVLAALHGLHFSVALMMLVFVTMNALGDRYDHEYYWGVTLCAWFWHLLGIVWLAILGVLCIAI